MAEPEYPILKELETKLKLRWVDTDDIMATQRAIIQVEPELAYLELPRGRKGDKGDPGPAISIQGVITADSQLPESAEVGHAYVNTSTKGLAVWNGSSWFKVDNFAGVDADVQQFSRWLAQLESEARRAANAANRAEFAAEETIQQVEGDFATRNYADSKEWHRGPITTAHQAMADVGVGAWNIASREHAVRLGLPMDYGSLQVMPIGSSRTAFFLGQTTGMWINASSGTTWGEWQHVPDSDEVSAGNGAAGLKTVAMALTSGSVLDGVAGRYRVLTQVTAPVLRWRIHVESRRLVYSTTGAFTLGAVYVGNHSGDGAMVGQQLIKSGTLSVPAGGEWVSPWLDASLLANETLIDLNVTGSSLFKSQATSWVYENGSWVSSKDSPVSIWVELETYDQVPVVGMIGDSTGAGQGADRPVFDSALYIAARNHKFIPMAYVYPGSSMQSMNDYDLHIYQRWAHLDKPDSVIIQSGSNDIHGGASTEELQTRFVDLVETAEMISPAVIGATVKARYPDSGEHQATLDAHNAFVKTRANGNRDYLDFYQAVSPTGTVASADSADAAHLSTSGHQKLATAFDSVAVSRPAWVDTTKELDAATKKIGAIRLIGESLDDVTTPGHYYQTQSSAATEERGYPFPYASTLTVLPRSGDDSAITQIIIPDSRYDQGFAIRTRQKVESGWPAWDVIEPTAVASQRISGSRLFTEHLDTVTEGFFYQPQASAATTERGYPWQVACTVTVLPRSTDSSALTQVVIPDSQHDFGMAVRTRQDMAGGWSGWDILDVRATNDARYASAAVTDQVAAINTILAVGDAQVGQVPVWNGSGFTWTDLDQATPAAPNTYTSTYSSTY